MLTTSYLETDFAQLASEWKQFCASGEDLPGGPAWNHPHEAKARLLLMGDAILPLIMQDLRATRWPGWTRILPTITGRDIVPAHHTEIDDVVWDWVAWYTFIYRLHADKINTYEP